MRGVLEDGIARLGLEVNTAQVDALMDYLALLQKWNKAYNLTAIKDPKQMVIYHVLDSLAIAPYITGQTVLDVGTGAGMPGVMLAILYPEKHITLLDSNGKKTRFLQHLKREMGLNNISIINERVEAVSTDSQFDCITSRAFASLSDMVALTRHLLAPTGRIAAMKGPKAKQEMMDAGLPAEQVKTYDLDVPFLNEARHLLVFGL